MFHGTMTLNKDRNELSTKKAYYNDRDYRKNAFLKNKNLKIKILLTFSWHGRHLGLPWLNAGSCHRPPQTNLGNSCLASLRSKRFQSSYSAKFGAGAKKNGRGRGKGGEETLSRCFTGFILSYAQEQRVKTPRRYSFTARTTAQHPKGFIAPKLLTRGRYSTNVYTDRLRPEVQPRTFLYTIFHEKVTPFFIPSIDKWYPFTYIYTLFRTLHSFSLL